MSFEDDLNTLAYDVCRKPKDISLKKCHQEWGKTNPLCNEYKQCRIQEKSKGQINYVTTSIENNIFLRSCPGSGKTEVVGLKTAYEIRNWIQPLGGIAVLSFTNNAATIIGKRVCQFNGIEKIGYPHFIGTIDSWLHGYIAHPFSSYLTYFKGINGDHSIRIIENTSDARFLNTYKSKYGLNQTGNIFSNQFYYELETEEIIFSSGKRDIDNIRNSAVLEKWQENDLIDTKNAFLKAGFATYQDIECICLWLLEDNPNLCEFLSKRFPLILIDECQDLSWIQLQILELLKKQGTVLHLVGDLDQAIYEFKKVDPYKVDQYTKDNKFKMMFLNDNYRSCQPIVDICNKLINNCSVIKSQNKPMIDNPCICLIYTREMMGDLVVRFYDLLNNNGIDISKSAIVARSWSNVSRLRPSGNNGINSYQKYLATSFFLWKTGNIQSMDDSLRYIGRFISEKFFQTKSSNSKQYYCPECITSHVRWRIFLSKILEECCDDKHPISNIDLTWLEWALKVRKYLGEIVRDYTSYIEHSLIDSSIEIPNLDGQTFRVPNNQGDQTVLSTLLLDNKESSPIRITTIHSVKGETLDALLLVSAPTKAGTTEGYWTQWLDDPTSEAARLAYVASSRPKYLLAWAVPKPTSEEKERITNLGFIIEE